MLYAKEKRGKVGKRLTKTDLVLVQKQVSKLAKYAVLSLNEAGGQVGRQSEHRLVFEWCIQSASQMLQAMTLRHQKQFIKKLND